MTTTEHHDTEERGLAYVVFEDLNLDVIRQKYFGFHGDIGRELADMALADMFRPPERPRPSRLFTALMARVC